MDLEEAAAERSYNANGRDPSLPPLPTKNIQTPHSISMNHPYGVRPYGNIYQENDISDVVRRRGLGMLAILNDDQLNINGAVLKFLDGVSLARALQCSRYMYVCCMLDTHWRDLVLRWCHNHDGCPIDFWNDWKTTYVRMVYGEQQQVMINPIKITGIFSDVLFRSFMCQQFDIADAWIEVDNIERINVDQCELSTHHFLKNYEEKNIPLIIEGASKNWPAIKKWNQKYLIENSNNKHFRATSACAPLPAQFTMESYFRYSKAAVEEMPLYLFDREFNKLAPQLLKDYEAYLKESCPYFDEAAEHGHDLFSLLGPTRRPDHRWLIIGPKRSGSAFHIDPNCTHAWNAPIVGRKRYVFCKI